MTDPHELLVEIHRVLDAHDAALVAMRASRGHLDAAAFKAGDDALVSAIDANRAALRLLNRLMTEGTA